MAAIPSVAKETKSELKSIPGIVPVPMNLPPGCGFYNRCDFAEDGICNVGDIPLIEVGPGHKVRCLKRGENEWQESHNKRQEGEVSVWAKQE